jgi:putative Holliday junction resolvase
MPVVPIAEMKLARGTRLLALDLGDKTIGLAMSDVTRKVATALQALAKKKFTANAAEIAALVVEHGIGGIVEKIGLPIALWDERLTTAAVTRTLIEADASRARRAKLVDKLAATYMLQGALDYLNGIESI